MGGLPLLALPSYLDHSPVLKASAMKASGLKSVVIAHGVLDGEVTSDQSDQTAAALALAGVSTDVYISSLATSRRSPATSTRSCSTPRSLASTPCTSPAPRRQG